MNNRTGFERRQNTRRSKEYWITNIGWFVFFILITFLANFLIGCGSTPTPSRFPAVDCKKEPKAFRCQVYMPEEEIEYDDFEQYGGMNER